MQVTSDNSQLSLFDQLSLDTEAFRSQIIESFATSAVDYADRCKKSKMENNRESFMEFMKFTTATAENTKVSAGRVQSILAPSNGGKSGAKPPSDVDLAMIDKMSKGTWNFNWKKDGCQKFSVTGKQKYTFCGSTVVRHSNFCSDCTKLKTIIKIKQDHDPFDPEEWYNTRVAAVYKKYGIDSKSGDSVPTTEKKVVKSAPPAKMTTTTTEINTPRAYKGKGVEPGGNYLWIHVDQLMGGFVIDSDNNLIGVSKVCGINGNIVEPTEAQRKRFETIAKKIPGDSSRVNTTAKPTSVLRSPVMPKTVKKESEEEEGTASLDEVVDGDDDDTN